MELYLHSTRRIHGVNTLTSPVPFFLHKYVIIKITKGDFFTNYIFTFNLYRYIILKITK